MSILTKRENDLTPIKPQIDNQHRQPKRPSYDKFIHQTPQTIFATAPNSNLQVHQIAQSPPNGTPLPPPNSQEYRTTRENKSDRDLQSLKPD